MEYSENDFLQLSGIQHFCFCRRQWALIHVEQQWQENIRTAEGKIVHEHCHDDSFVEKRRGLLITRGLRICSRELGVSGQCDVVEFYRADCGCRLHGYEGEWLPYPVEYKRGRSKLTDADRLQLCGQAMCLETMLMVQIPEGALYYHETHRREVVKFTTELRAKVRDMLIEMHGYYQRGYTPKVKPKTRCRLCSMYDVCLPLLCTQDNVSDYFNKFL